MLTYHLMTEQEKELASSWQYEGEYAIYNEPSYQEQKEKGIGFGNPARDKNFYAYCDGPDVGGFHQHPGGAAGGLYRHRRAARPVRAGLRPQMMKLAQTISQTLYPGKPLYLEVRSWNRRAIRCYEKAGFVAEGEPFIQRTPIGRGRVYPHGLAGVDGVVFEVNESSVAKI